MIRGGFFRGRFQGGSSYFEKMKDKRKGGEEARKENE